MGIEGGIDRARLEAWLASLEEKDPELYAELNVQRQKLSSAPAGLVPEGAVPETIDDLALETIVRQGRPALLVRDRRIVPPGDGLEPAAATIVKRLAEATPTLEPLIPLVGRIDVGNFPVGNVSFVGTGWLIDRNIVVTNRHVAELIARQEAAAFRFRPGRFGLPLQVTVDYRHEHDVAASEPVRVTRVLWIEMNANRADIALLEVDGTRRMLPDGTPPFITVAHADAAPNAGVAVVGYPARAPAHVIPDQAWMDRIYGSTYDIKRIAPGMMGGNSRGSATHDCTTLGGNSGSVVLDMKSGEAVGLHFAGLYMVENYAVPASVIRGYLKSRPWHPSRRAGQPEEASGDAVSAPSGHAGAASSPSTHGAGQAAATFTIPLTLTVSIGVPEVGAGPSAAIAFGVSSPPASSIDDAVHALRQERSEVPLADVWAGYLLEDGELSDDPCIVVTAAPERLEEVRAAMPASYRGFPVDVRLASVIEQLGEHAVAVEEAVSTIAYNDADRTGPGFSFGAVDEEMELLLHVGPERSWVVLREFLSGARTRLVSSMYEFHAKHIAQAVQKKLLDGANVTLVLGGQSRDHGQLHEGDFDRSRAFAKWEAEAPERFKTIFVPTGTQGLVANAYHIKVTVRDEGDDAMVWLSSGNWKRTSQPLIRDADLHDPRVTSRAGNREWHLVARSKTLAERFRNHIVADFDQSRELGGTPESLETTLLVDVPLPMLEAVELEAAASRVIESKRIPRRTVKVKPLLTPDQRGAIYSRAVLQLIRSARRQLLFQIPYISVRGATGGFFKQLVDALVDRSKRIADFRLLLRSPIDDLPYNMSQLKRRGLDVATCVRSLAHTHTKGMVVDGTRVLVGSHNWSAAGVTLNRDASLLFDDAEIAQYFAEAFEVDWERAREIRLDERPVNEAPRPAIGDQPPPGFRRMTLADYLEP